jgi:hypothetical protein
VTRYLELAEYLWLAEQVTGVEARDLVRASRVDRLYSAGGIGISDGNQIRHDWVLQLHPDWVNTADLVLRDHPVAAFVQNEESVSHE